MPCENFLFNVFCGRHVPPVPRLIHPHVVPPDSGSPPTTLHVETTLPLPAYAPGHPEESQSLPKKKNSFAPPGQASRAPSQFAADWGVKGGGPAPPPCFALNTTSASWRRGATPPNLTRSSYLCRSRSHHNDASYAVHNDGTCPF